MRTFTAIAAAFGAAAATLTFNAPPAVANQSPITVEVRQWQANASALTSAQKASLRQQLKPQSTHLNATITCTAYVRSTTTSSSTQLATARAKATCAYAKSLTKAKTVTTTKKTTSTKKLTVVDVTLTTTSLPPATPWPQDTGTEQFSNADDCKITSTGSQWNTVGFPVTARFGGAATIATLPLQGVIKALVIPVDFANAPGTTTPQTFIDPIAQRSRDFYRTMSYGQVTFDFTVLPRYVRMPRNPQDYQLSQWNEGDYRQYYVDGLTEAAKQFTINGYDVVYVIASPQTPVNALTPGPAFLLPEQSEDGGIPRGAATGNPGSTDEGFRWLVHETGHLFGWADLYDVSDTDDRQGNRFSRFGWWDIMSMNWERFSIELNGWFRFQTGWLTNSNVLCLSAPLTNDITVSLTALNNSQGPRIIAIRTSKEKVLVIEKRTVTTYAPMLGASSAGLLVYEVDGTKPAATAPVSIVKKSTMTYDIALTNAALKVNESVITANGLRVTHQRTSATQSVVNLQQQ